MTNSARYRVPYDVQADSQLTAILAAGRLLRHGVAVLKVVSTVQFAVGWWTVVLLVEENLARLDEPPEPLWLHLDPAFVPESADPVTAAKWEADRGR